MTTTPAPHPTDPDLLGAAVALAARVDGYTVVDRAGGRLNLHGGNIPDHWAEVYDTSVNAADLRGFARDLRAAAAVLDAESVNLDCGCRPLIRDRDGRARAALVLHNPAGFTIAGVLSEPRDDRDLLEASHLRDLYAAVRAERETIAAEMDGRDPQAVGVRSWTVDQTTVPPTLRLALDPIPLSDWVASRTVFASLPENERVAQTAGREYGTDALFGTHLGYTATVVTADNQLVYVRRTGKLLADGLNDSAIGDTALVTDLVGGRWDARDALVSAGRRFLGLLPEHFVSLSVAVLGTRVDDSGLWVSGHARISLTAEELSVAVTSNSDHPDASRLTFIPWTEAAGAVALAAGVWTPWAMADMASALNIDFGTPLA